MDIGTRCSYEMPVEYTVPADGTIPYLYYTMPTNFTEDKWISAMEIRPGNRKVVHHVIAYAQEAGAKDTNSGGEGDLRRGGRVHLGGITPNKTGIVYDKVRRVSSEGTAFFPDPYTTNGEVTNDRTKIVFVFSRRQEDAHYGNATMEIRPSPAATKFTK